LLVRLGCHSNKIASADMNHLPLIRKAAQTGLCVQIDTGNACFAEIEQVVDVIRSEFNDKIIIHHCPVGYPAGLDQVNLRVIQTLKQVYPEIPIAFSDHNPGHELDLMALALGVSMLEKTITSDRMIDGPEHMASLQDDELIEFVSKIRSMEQVLGRTWKPIQSESDISSKNIVRRGVYLAEDAVVGQSLGEVEVEFRRPGSSFGPSDYEKCSNFVFKYDLPQGYMVGPSDLEG